MVTVAYLANQLPSPTEPYVTDEVEELRRRGVRVITCSVKRPPAESPHPASYPDLILQEFRLTVLCQACWLLLSRFARIVPFLGRILLFGTEKPLLRIKALLHTFLGAYFAALLKQRVDHIHVHHGYFGSWITMVAARLLDVPFSMTLHGSDLLLHGAFLDTKLTHCRFCCTISEYNRRFVLQKYPLVDAEKILVSRLGVEVESRCPVPELRAAEKPFTVLAVGRLHRTKDHEFLIRGCAAMRKAGADFKCLIAGSGPEHRRLEMLIEESGLRERVVLLGYVSHESLAPLYEQADVVVLTSRSEGIPLVLMEAMARGRIVLAPMITGIPELVIHGKNGFLYQPGSLSDFTEQLSFLHSFLRSTDRVEAGCLDWIRHTAHLQVRQNFNRRNNLEAFANLFLSRVQPRKDSLPHEDLVLQQI